MTVERQGPWAVLDIAPTQDARQIKRAYAARLKVVRPDEDATGFQALREAYEHFVQRGEITDPICKCPRCARAASTPRWRPN